MHSKKIYSAWVHFVFIGSQKSPGMPSLPQRTSPALERRPSGIRAQGAAPLGEAHAEEVVALRGLCVAVRRPRPQPSTYSPKPLFHSARIRSEPNLTYGSEKNLSPAPSNVGACPQLRQGRAPGPPRIRGCVDCECGEGEADHYAPPPRETKDAGRPCIRNAPLTFARWSNIRTMGLCTFPFDSRIKRRVREGRGTGWRRGGGPAGAKGLDGVVPGGLLGRRLPFKPRGKGRNSQVGVPSELRPDPPGSPIFLPVMWECFATLSNFAALLRACKNAPGAIL